MSMQRTDKDEEPYTNNDTTQRISESIYMLNIHKHRHVPGERPGLRLALRRTEASALRARAAGESRTGTVSRAVGDTANAAAAADVAAATLRAAGLSDSRLRDWRPDPCSGQREPCCPDRVGCWCCICGVAARRCCGDRGGGSEGGLMLVFACVIIGSAETPSHSEMAARTTSDSVLGLHRVSSC